MFTFIYNLFFNAVGSVVQAVEDQFNFGFNEEKLPSTWQQAGYKWEGLSKGDKFALTVAGSAYVFFMYILLVTL